MPNSKELNKLFRSLNFAYNMMRNVGKGPYAIWTQRRSRWACACMQSDLDILCWQRRPRWGPALSTNCIRALFVRLCINYVFRQVCPNLKHQYVRSRNLRKRYCWHVCPTQTQISLRIRTVWSESSLSAWMSFAYLTIQYLSCEDSDQAGECAELIWISLRKHAYLNILKNFTTKKGKFSDKKIWYFHFLLKT